MTTDRDYIFSLVNYVLLYAQNATDWLLIKKELLLLCKPKHRSMFSRRHYSTKKHMLNDFEKEIIDYWKEKTGIELTIEPNMIHDINWIRKGHGWGLMKYNKEQYGVESKKNRKKKKCSI